jgi:ADP-heptose:LPS heptosyltransferase
LDLVLAGSSAESPLGAQDLGATNLCGKTNLRQLVALLEGASLVIANDSGPMHIAAAVGTPTIAIFGPTDPARVGPLGSGHQVLAVPVPCGPCFRSGKFPDCPRAVCLEGVRVSHVMDAVQRALLQGACPMLL